MFQRPTKPIGAFFTAEEAEGLRKTGKTMIEAAAMTSDGINSGQALLGGRPVLINLAGLNPTDSAAMGHVILQLMLDTILDSPPDPTRQIAGYIDEAHRLAPVGARYSA
jgi:hypothetical protein